MDLKILQSNWLIDWLTDWLIDWLIDWLMDCHDWLILLHDN